MLFHGLWIGSCLQVPALVSFDDGPLGANIKGISSPSVFGPSSLSEQQKPEL